MRFKFLLMLFVLVLCSVSVLGVSPFQTTPESLEDGIEVIYPINEYYHEGHDEVLSFDVVNLSNGIRLNSSLVTCSFVIVNSHGDFLIDGFLEYNVSLGYWFKEVNTTVTGVRGLYPYYVYCEYYNGEFGGFVSSAIVVNAGGSEPVASLVWIYGFCIFVVLAILLLFVYFASKIGGDDSYNFGGDLVEINYGRYLKLLLWGFAYECFVFLSYLCLSLSRHYLYVNNVESVFFVIFWITIVVQLPLWFVIILVTILDWVMKVRLLELTKRGLKPRK